MRLEIAGRLGVIPLEVEVFGTHGGIIRKFRMKSSLSNGAQGRGLTPS